MNARLTRSRRLPIKPASRRAFRRFKVAHEAHLPTKQAGSQEAPWLPPAHGDHWRAQGAGAAPGQRAQAPVCLRPSKGKCLAAKPGYPEDQATVSGAQCRIARCQARIRSARPGPASGAWRHHAGHDPVWHHGNQADRQRGGTQPGAASAARRRQGMAAGLRSAWLGLCVDCARRSAAPAPCQARSRP
jgi:hypothetical protein